MWKENDAQHAQNTYLIPIKWQWNRFNGFQCLFYASIYFKDTTTGRVIEIVEQAKRK